MKRPLLTAVVLICSFSIGISGARALYDWHLRTLAQNIGSPDPGTPNPLAARDEIFTEDMTWMEIRDARDAGRNCVLVATGGVEQNGPYVTTGKHNRIVRAVAIETARRLGDCLVAPIIPFVPQGDIDPPSLHMKYPGTISLTEATYRKLLTEIGECWRVHGFAHVVFVGDSYGNLAGMEAVAAELDARWPDQRTRFHYVPEFYNYDSANAWLESQGLHQTPEWLHDEFSVESMLLALDPNSVRMEERLAAGKFSINKVDLAPVERSAAWGRKLIEFRATEAAAAIDKARRARPAAAQAAP